MALDLDLTYAQVAFKASHNSYERDEQPVSTHFGALGVHTWEGRCRGIELDINLSGRNWLWSVNHIGGYGGSADQQLTAYLADLSRWHKANPDHQVVTITLDLKGDGCLDQAATVPSALSSQLDAVLREAFPDAIFRPRDLQGNSPTLLEGAANWPSLKVLTGKFIVFLSGSSSVKRLYAEGADGEACCFLDRKFSPGDTFKPEETADIVFYNFDVDAWSSPTLARQLKTVVRQIAEDGRCIVRGYLINNVQAWKDARDAGFTILTTDKVRAHAWATVGAEPFMPRIQVARGAPRGRGGRSTHARAVRARGTSKSSARKSGARTSGTSRSETRKSGVRKRRPRKRRATGKRRTR